MLKNLLMVLSIGVVAGCFPASVNGTIDGKSLSIVAGRALLTEGDLASIDVLLSEIPFDLKEAKAADHDGKSFFTLGAAPPGKGEFTIVNPLDQPDELPENFGIANLVTLKDTECDGDAFNSESDIATADSGTITLATDPKLDEELSGTFEVKFGDDEVTGSFTIKVEKREEDSLESNTKCLE